MSETSSRYCNDTTIVTIYTAHQTVDGTVILSLPDLRTMLIFPLNLY